jgi:hypothetical protein
MRADSYVIRYQHLDCKVDPGVEWYDLWACACNGECPVCGTRDIEPVEWTEASRAFVRPEKELPSA